MDATTGKRVTKGGLIAICGNPNSGKTTIFNAITGLTQRVGNYPGVTVEKVSGQFTVSEDDSRKFTLIDIPGSYSLSAFTPDEYIAASALFGEIKGERSPDAIICVIDATNLERGLYLLFQIMQIGCPVVVALNMIDIAQRKGLRINHRKLSKTLGGVPVVPVVGNRGRGIDRLKRETDALMGTPFELTREYYEELTEGLLAELVSRFGNEGRSKAQYLRIIFDVDGPAEKEFVRQEGEAARTLLRQGRGRIKERFGSLSAAETQVLTARASEICDKVVRSRDTERQTLSERVDRYLLHQVLGPIVLVGIMVLVFHAIFSWAEPFMGVIEGAFASLAGAVEKSLPEGPLCSLLTDGVIGGVGSVLVFIPQIVVLFAFIAILEDSGYMPRAAFLVDRMFSWCGLSGKSFIPMLSSFACAVPGIMATRTIDDRKLRFITIMVAPLMSCSARLPVYSIMIAAFIPYKSYFGLFNLQGLVLTLLYLLGIFVAIVVSFVLKKTWFKTERGTFLMEMPSYKLPMPQSILVRVINRAKCFVVRAGTVILAITIVIWALSYYPRSDSGNGRHAEAQAALVAAYDAGNADFERKLASMAADRSEGMLVAASDIEARFGLAEDEAGLGGVHNRLLEEYPFQGELIRAYHERRLLDVRHRSALTELANEKAGYHIRNSYFGIAGRAVEPLFEPLGWDWKITMSVLASFPAREVIIATLGTIYNLGTEVDEESSLVDKLRKSRWEEGPKKGKPVFSPAVALSIVVFFALCCQCGATVVTIRQETRSWGYAVLAFSYMTVLAYVSALVVYQLLGGIAT